MLSRRILSISNTNLSFEVWEPESEMCTYKDLCALYGVLYRTIKNQLKPFLNQIGPRTETFP